MYDSQKSSLDWAVQDFTAGAKRWRVWGFLGYAELIARFRGSVVAFLAWNMLGFGLFCLVILTLFGQSLGGGGASIVSGFLAYTLIAGLINDSCTTFASASAWLKGIKIPYGVFIYKVVFKQFLAFLISLITSIVILTSLGDLHLGLGVFWAVPGIFIILLNGVFCCALFGALSVRFHDVVHLVNTTMRFALFATPILWLPSGNGGIRDWMAQLNPITYFVDIVRDPMLHGSLPVSSWLLVLALSIGLGLLSALVYVRSRNRIVFWL